MKRLTYTIESTKGFLRDVEDYTDDLLEAVTFTNFDVAAFRLNTVRDRLRDECWVSVIYMDFPRLKPAPVLAQVH
jgi:hypothetical protein